MCPDEVTRDRIRQRLVWCNRLAIVVAAVSAVLVTSGRSLAGGCLLLAAFVACYALGVRAWTRGLARTRVPLEARSLSARVAVLGAALRGWRLWWRIAVLLLGMAISVHIIRTGIGAPPAVGWLALAACAFALTMFVWAAWSDRRSRRA